MPSRNLHLSQPRYVEALKRQLDRIEGGLTLSGDDCTVPGMKSTECSWGLCSNEQAAWPDPQDHLWPDQFPRRIAPLYRQPQQKCPLDRAELDDGPSSGCFFRCRFFSPEEPVPNRQQVISLYRNRINLTNESTP